METKTVDGAVELHAEMERYVEEFAGKARADVVEIVKDAGRFAVKAVRAKSPKRTGRYARGWAWSEEDAGGTGFYIRVYNKLKPHLTHLIENGYRQFFMGRDTGKRKPARPHIAPAADETEEYIMQRVRRG